MSWYAFLRGLTGALSRLLTPTEVEGREHVPRKGPFILVPNHQSVLDPIYVQVAAPRTDLYTLTKSTQFGSGLFRWLLPRLQTIPTRRYRIDPQVVRVALRHLGAGRGICIYAEGERTWDGSVGHLRRGTIRLILKAGVPVVPCGVSGSYDVWPRWSRRVRRRRVRVRFGPRLAFGGWDDRRERDARVDETSRRIRRALLELSGAPPAPREPGFDGIDGPEARAGAATGVPEGSEVAPGEPAPARVPDDAHEEDG